MTFVPARPGVLGILNVTPDSFSDGGRHATVELAVRRAFEIVDEGACALDVGGESTRPGAPPVDSGEEKRRVLPVLEALAARGFPLPISVDTRKPAVAREALARGARAINDVTGLADAEMREVVAASGAAAIVMHMRGTPETMQKEPVYDDVVREVEAFLVERVNAARAAGVRDVLVDPGIGFGKTAEHNWLLLAATERLARVGPLVVGVSRKAFLGKLLGGRPPEERAAASVGAALAAVARGAILVRAHDVRLTADALKAFLAV